MSLSQDDKYVLELEKIARCINLDTSISEELFEKLGQHLRDDCFFLADKIKEIGFDNLGLENHLRLIEIYAFAKTKHYNYGARYV